MADGCCDFRRPTKHSRPDGSLRRHRQKEVGDQLRFYVDVRFCVGSRRLGSLRLQHGVRATVVSVPRQAWIGGIGRVYVRPSDSSGSGSGHARPRLSDGDADVLPIRVCGDHGYHLGRIGLGPHEFHGLDDLLPDLDDAGLHRGRVQPLGWRLACDLGRGGLLGWLRDPSRGRRLRVHRRLGSRPASSG